MTSITAWTPTDPTSVQTRGHGSINTPLNSDDSVPALGRVPLRICIRSFIRLIVYCENGKRTVLLSKRLIRTFTGSNGEPGRLAHDLTVVPYKESNGLVPDY